MTQAQRRRMIDRYVMRKHTAKPGSTEHRIATAVLLALCYSGEVRTINGIARRVRRGEN